VLIRGWLGGALVVALRTEIWQGPCLGLWILEFDGIRILPCRLRRSTDLSLLLGVGLPFQTWPGLSPILATKHCLFLRRPRSECLGQNFCFPFLFVVSAAVAPLVIDLNVWMKRSLKDFFFPLLLLFCAARAFPFPFVFAYFISCQVLDLLRILFHVAFCIVYIFISWYVGKDCLEISSGLHSCILLHAAPSSFSPLQCILFHVVANVSS